MTRRTIKENKNSLCKRRGYHEWIKNLNSLSEDYNTMYITSTCEDCGATFEISGDWENLPDEDEE